MDRNNDKVEECGRMLMSQESSPGPRAPQLCLIILENTVNILKHLWAKRVGSLKSLKFPLKQTQSGAGKWESLKKVVKRRLCLTHTVQQVAQDAP